MNLTTQTYESVYKQQLYQILITLRKEMLISPSLDINNFLDFASREWNAHFTNWVWNQILAWHDLITQLKPLQAVCNSNFEELIIHSNDHQQIISACTITNHTQEFISQEDYEFFWQYLSLHHGQAWNFNNPFSSFKLIINGYEYRISLLHYSLSVSSLSKVYLRKSRTQILELDSFNLSNKQDQLLKNLIIKKQNILICGATGSGKTSFLNAMIKNVDPKEHIVILEDTEEISLKNINCTHLLSRNCKNSSLSDYCSYAMRMRPSRIILGEMRSDEIIPFFLAMSSGHGGLMSTIHAQSGVMALHRAALLYSIYCSNPNLKYEAILQLICQSINYVITIENKRVCEIIKIIGSSGSTPYYETITTSEMHHQ